MSPVPDRDDQAFDLIRDAIAGRLKLPPEPGVVLGSPAWVMFALDEHLRAVVAYTRAVHKLVAELAAGAGVPGLGPEVVDAQLALTAVEDSRDLLDRYAKTTPPPEEPPE